MYVSKKYSSKIFEFLEDDDDEAIQHLIDEDKARKYEAKDFRPDFKKDLQSDLAILKEIDRLWKGIDRDPKLLTLIGILSSHEILRDNKLIIFTESKETAEYLEKHLAKKLPNQVLSFSGSSGAATRDKVIANFDARAKFPADDYRILITTEVLSEGVNLHRSNVVINYDIPCVKNFLKLDCFCFKSGLLMPEKWTGITFLQKRRKYGTAPQTIY